METSQNRDHGKPQSIGVRQVFPGTFHPPIVPGRSLGISGTLRQD
jgi:hypothetical protein